MNFGFSSGHGASPRCWANEQFYCDRRFAYKPRRTLLFVIPTVTEGSAFCFLLSAFCFLLSAFCFLLSAFCFLLSAFCFCVLALVAAAFGLRQGMTSVVPQTARSQHSFSR
jgi:hypothetical protein